MLILNKQLAIIKLLMILLQNILHPNMDKKSREGKKSVGTKKGISHYHYLMANKFYNRKA